MVYGSQGDLGKRIVIADAEFASNPLYTQAANGTLFGGVFQPVYIDPAATVANLTTGKIAYLKDITPTGGVADSGAKVYCITDSAHADAASLIAGVCLTPTVTAGNYTVIQVHGKVNIQFTATLTGTGAIGSPVIAGGATAGTADVPAAGSPTYATLGQYLGNAIVAPTNAGLTAVQLKTFLGRY